MIDPTHSQLSVLRQCQLLGLSRSGYYYTPRRETAENLEIMRKMDEIYTQHPFYGSRKMVAILNREGYAINRKRVQRLMRLMGYQAIYPKPNTSASHPEHQVYPYLLRNVEIQRVNQVWSTDITYIPMTGGFMYLVAIIDWFSRYVLSWNLSNTMDQEFCIEALGLALQQAQPEIFNSDQGSQFTALAFTQILKDHQIRISMDGRGRALDNIFVERLWRSVKYEHLYLMDYQNGTELYQGLKNYFEFYNTKRPHQSLEYGTPHEIFFNKKNDLPEGNVPPADRF